MPINSAITIPGNWASSWGQMPQGYGHQSAQSYFQSNPNMIGSYWQGHGSLSNYLGQQYPNWFNSQVGGAGTPRPTPKPFNPNVNAGAYNPQVPGDSGGGDVPNVYNPNPNPYSYMAAQRMPAPGNPTGTIDQRPTSPIIQNPKVMNPAPSNWANQTPGDSYMPPAPQTPQPYTFNPNSPTFHPNRGMGYGIGGFRSGGWF